MAHRHGPSRDEVWTRSHLGTERKLLEGFRGKSPTMMGGLRRACICSCAQVVLTRSLPMRHAIVLAINPIAVPSVLNGDNGAVRPTLKHQQAHPKD